MVTSTGHKGDWGFVCGRVAVCEGRLLNDDFFQTLAAHAQLEDLMRQMNDTELRDFVTPGADWEDWSAVIDRYFHAHVLSIRHDCPTPAVADMFIVRDDYQNLKHAILGDARAPFPSLYLTREHLAAVAGGDVSALPQPFKDAAVRAREALEAANNPAWIDMVLDGAFLRHVLALASESGAPLIKAYAAEFVMARSVFALWRLHLSSQELRRFQQFALPLGPATPVVNELIGAGDPKNWADLLTGRIGEIFREATATIDGDEAQRFEDMTMNYLVALARQGQGQVAGPERVFSYLRSLASETHNLKLVVCGKLNRIDAPVLKQRLRAKHA